MWYDDTPLFLGMVVFVMTTGDIHQKPTIPLNNINQF
jgi:hypothetical protein